MNRRKLGLSKSLYLRGLQCHKSLYLHKNHEHLGIDRDILDDSQKAIFTSGTEVGKEAQKLFPGGVEISVDDLKIPERARKTRELLGTGIETIYEASFEYDGLFVMVDILHKGENGWDLYEVKSSTSVKSVNHHDIAFQVYVLSGAGLELNKSYLVHINSSYVRQGALELDRLFSINDLTEEAALLQSSVPENVEVMRSTLEAGGIPHKEIGPHCSDPYECDFHNYCWWSNLSKEDSIFALRGRGIDKFAYYSRGIKNMEDLPLHELNESQAFQAEKHITKGEKIDPEGILDFLNTLWYPLCHFDFETFTNPIPHYAGLRPYQQVPFQYSMHVQHVEGGPVEHFEFLARPNMDPREDLIKKMIQDIPVGACVLTYNMAFEKTRIQELINAFPHHADRLTHILNNVRDLIVPFRRRYAYRWQQHGSNSIKKVLPAFIPGMSYKDLEISDGGMAMDAYHLMCSEKNPAEHEKIRHNLLLYCKKDTEAMVKLHECLGNMVTDHFIKIHQ